MRNKNKDKGKRRNRKRVRKLDRFRNHRVENRRERANPQEQANRRVLVSKAKPPWEPTRDRRARRAKPPWEPMRDRRARRAKPPWETSMGAYEGKPGKPAKVGKVTGAGKPGEAATATTAGKLTATGKGTATGKPYKVQNFKLPTNTTPTKFTAVNFQQGRHIQGSQNWQGQQYAAFRNYNSEWHDQGWWHSHSNNVVFVFGGWYAFNAGYWYPAWGYAPNSYYAYDGPIYAYNNLPPDQVIANVQSALQQQGYYQGEVDGLLGPQTRAAIADYQRANGLAETASVDQPTLESLGMS